MRNRKNALAGYDYSNESLYRAILLGCSLGGLALAAAIGYAILVDPQANLRDFAVTYAFYFLVLALNLGQGLPIIVRTTALVTCLTGISWSSLLVIGIDTGPVLISFLAVLTSALLLPHFLTFTLLTLSTFVVWLSADIVAPFTLTPFLTAAGFLTTAAAALTLILYVTFILKGQIEERSTYIESLERETYEKEIAQRKLNSARDALEEARRFEAIGRVSGSVAHEFNNLLQVISSWIEVLESESKTTNEVPHEILFHIKEAALGAGSITRDLLTVARRTTQHASPIDIGKLVSEKAYLWQQLVPEGTDLIVVVEATARSRVNEGLLQQCLLNLLKNALTTDVGSKSIEIRVTTPTDGQLQICVSDDGCGMGQEEIERAFEPFYSTRGESGTGLGLSITRGIIEEFGGEISLASELAVGTKVIITLPVTSDDEAQPSDNETSVGIGELQVLLVEDDDRVRTAMSKMLANQGMIHEACASGDDAVANMESADFDLLCIDAQMPGMPPIDAIKSFKLVFPAGKVLICSGNVSDKELLDYIQQESIPVLQKPFSSSQLYASIDKAMLAN